MCHLSHLVVRVSLSARTVTTPQQRSPSSLVRADVTGASFIIAAKIQSHLFAVPGPGRV